VKQVIKSFAACEGSVTTEANCIQ